MRQVEKFALIPARSGSKRVKDKNIIDVCGKPLIQYTLDLVKEMQFFDRIFVSTDSDEYAKIVTELSDAEIHKRPFELSLDHSADIEWIHHLIGTFNIDPDAALFILRPTSPLRSGEFVTGAWDKFITSRKSYDSLRAVKLADQHPGKMWTEINGDLMPLFPFSINDVPWHSNQTAVLPKVYAQTASLEIVWAKTVLETRSLSGSRILPYVCSGHDAFDVNTAEDIDYLRALLQ